MERLAPEALWWACTNRGQTGPRGVLLLDVGLALEDMGQPPLALWPYKIHLGSGTEDPPSAAGPGPWLTAAFREIPLAHDGIEDRVEDQLSAGNPVVLVVEMTDEFDSPDDEGHVSVPDIRAPAGDYHAVVTVGAATDARQGRRLLIRNSWGGAWALGGYCWLPLGYLVNFAAQAAVVSVQ